MNNNSSVISRKFTYFINKFAGFLLTISVALKACQKLEAFKTAPVTFSRVADNTRDPGL